MKTQVLLFMMMLFASISFSQTKISQVVGDTKTAPNLKQELKTIKTNVSSVQQSITSAQQSITSAQQQITAAQQELNNNTFKKDQAVYVLTIAYSKTEINNLLNRLLGVDSIRYDSAQKRFKYLAGDRWYSIAVHDSTIIPSSLITGLYAYYKLDETSGSIIDALGVKTGTNSGAVAAQAGKLNTGYDFDTNTDYLYFPYTGNSNNQVTLSFWFNLDITPATAARSYFLSGSMMANYSQLWNVQINTGNQITVQETNVAGTVISFSSTSWLTTSTGTWYHCVVVTPAIGSKGKIYLNGVNVTNDAVSTAFSGVKKTPDFRFYLGNLQAASNAIDGKMDEFGLWTRALTDAEIAVLYNTGIGKSHPFTDF